MGKAVEYVVVRKVWLKIANGLLWFAAGFNILRIGIKAAMDNGTLVWLWCIPVFIAFDLMFSRVIGKNSRRIDGLEGEKAPIWRFMNLRGYLIIAFMMTLGIVLRASGKLPDAFFAFFYTGLGTALAFEGLKGLARSIFRKQERG